MNKNKFYITTPLYYVNSKPHLGTLYSTVIADVAARWNKILGKKVFFLTGTDEHGQKIQEKATVAGKQPKEFVDAMVPEFKKTWQQYEIEYTRFIRTTDGDHEKAVAYWIKKLQDQGDIYKSVYSGLYCIPCETFVSVTTDTPRNEQGEPLCPSCKRLLQEVNEESYFFRLSAYENQLLEFYEKHPDFITPKERLNEIVSFVKSGLKDLSISRKTISWGIPFPGDNQHTVYVWGDALNNYISAVGYGQESKAAEENLNFWWPANIHVIGKDIVRFHAVYWPAFLMAAGLNLPHKLLVHGFILMGDQKMSKSLGNAVDPSMLVNTYGPETIRYYLLRQFPINQDCQFDIKDLEEKITADLANNLGNLLNRMVTLSLNNGFTEIKAPTEIEAKTGVLKEKCEETFRIFWEEMNKCHFHVALAEVWRLLSAVNAYFHEQQPWILVKKDPELFQEVMYATCHSLYLVGVILWPVMPKKMEMLLASLGYVFKPDFNYESELRENGFKRAYKLSKLSEPLFVRPESKIEKENLQQSNVSSIAEGTKTENGGATVITIDEFSTVELRVGTVVNCEPVDGSEKLYKLQVDFGRFGVRQILSGVAQYFKPEELIGRQGVYVVNLAPRKMLGLVSQGMMLFAKDDKGSMQMVTVGGKVENGTKIS